MSSKLFYLGMRVEIANRFMVKDLEKKYNSIHKDTKIFDLCKNGRITVEKKSAMLMAKGIKNDKLSTSGLTNFSVMRKISKDEEARRIVQIINVLGNDRLIRERISLFINCKSLLNAIPELDILRTAFLNIESVMPGFIKTGWYYAPEALF
jgi:hypothetical protein